MKKDVNSLFNSIKLLVEEARKQVVRNVNTIMTYTYFEIGRRIVLNEQGGKERASYSENVLKQLSEKLSKEFGKGYSVDNLERFRKFYLLYHQKVSAPVVQQSKDLIKSASAVRNSTSVISLTEFGQKFKLSWTHYVTLLKMDDFEQRNFYEIESFTNDWSVRELQRQYHSSLYERLAVSKNKKAVKKLSHRGQIIEEPIDAIKNPFVLEFLNLKEDTSYTETELETAIIDKLEHFMLELGKGFLYEGRQKRITFEGDSFYVDLVFYNRLLKCFVIIDLKIGKLTHQDIGQMQMYVNYYDRKVKLPDENATIGIVLCKEENKTVVEFTLPENSKTIFAREYKLYLPGKEELRKQLE
jgi:predicted nuclease of restriction endonuclease-like (RecB) superfamily